VTNHNYAEFLPGAVRSALAQQGTAVEVIVVDDGSTDSSREVIAGFGDSVRAYFQGNEGQTSAVNAGFAACSGDVVIFLDADDELAPGLCALVEEAFASDPRAGRVVFRLEVVDEHGRATGAVLPALGRPLPEGDVRRAARWFPDLAWPPMSGNAFAAWMLRRLLPFPPSEEPTGADQLLHSLTPLLAPVVALPEPGGRYRLHGRNTHFRSQFDVERSRYVLRRAAKAEVEVERLTGELGYRLPPVRSVTLAAHRLVSLRLGGDHPIADDGRLRALSAGVRAALGRTDVGVRRRIAYVGWFVIVAVAPRSAVERLAHAIFRPRRAAWLARLAR
jgi:glycosyltransferase involved in cell wall biosynthesis